MEQFTQADALLLYLSGATSDGGSQADPDLSIGNYRSSSLLEAMGFIVDNSIPGVKIERVGIGNGPGIGTLEAYDGNKLRWSAPGDTPGTGDIVINGQTRMLISGDGDTSKYIVVTRSTEDDLAGSAAVTLVPVYNNTVGFSNIPDGSSADKIRCLVFKHVGSRKIKGVKIWIATLGTQQTSDDAQLGASGSGTIGTSGSFADWPDSGFCRITQSDGTLREIVYYSERTDDELTVPSAGREQLDTTASAGAATDTVDAVPGIKIALEAPSGGHFTVPSNEYDTSAVSGLSWSTGIEKDDGLFIASLDPDDIYAVWIWLAVVSGRTASPMMENSFNWEFGVYDLVTGAEALSAGL